MQKKKDLLRKQVFFGAGEVIRTLDLLITNQLLYQLSHSSKTEGYLTCGNLDEWCYSTSVSAAFLLRFLGAVSAAFLEDFLVSTGAFAASFAFLASFL